ncbi:hypothetical protein N0V94_007757 [Neodidymelliopsis sp. IMI 364377]|nr:hypothetical protein N0V94_007757 [Neodidymelliopsis sp. IMI 364377]
MEARGTTDTEPVVHVHQQKDTPLLRYRMRTLWLLAFYVPLVILPWVFTCVLSTRPINGSSYVNQQGFLAKEIKSIRNWKTAVDVLNSIVALITIPFLSAVLAQAAVVFCQRQHAGQFLSLKDMFALADRAWTNPGELWRSVRSSTKRKEMGTKSSGPFLLLAAALIIIGAVQQPLYQILVPMETVVVTSCSDTRFRYSTRNDTHCQDGIRINYSTLGTDIEPAQLAQIYHNNYLPRVASDLAAIGLDEEQNNIWSDTMSSRAWSNRFTGDYSARYEKYRSLRSWLPSFHYDEKTPLPTFFVTGFRTNTTTGVLREHLMRMNSSVQCKEIEKSTFPSPCQGENPFVARLQKSKDTDIRVCVPGKVGAFPWKLSRNRQDITEEIYLDLWDGDLSGWPSPSFRNISGTIRCEVKTTRGYFELGNSLNNDTYGPLLDQWPNYEQMRNDFNDFVELDSDEGTSYIPTESDNFAGDEAFYTYTGVPSMQWRTSGPLMTSAIAMFGNTSWLHNVIRYSANTTYESRNMDKLEWDRLCAGMPYGGLFGAHSRGFPSPAQSCRGIENSISTGYRPNSMTLLDIIHEWIEGFVPAEYKRELTSAETLLHISLYIANRALLTFNSPRVSGQGDSFDLNFKGRVIQNAPGQSVQKPVVSTTAVIILSVLMSLQLSGLAYLAYYIYRVPTWTGAFDAMAIAQIGASVRNHDVLPPLGPVTQRDRDALRTVDALVGIDHTQDLLSVSRSSLAPDLYSAAKSSDSETRLVELKDVAPRGGGGARLGLGAEGVITSAQRQRKEKRKGGDEA